MNKQQLSRVIDQVKQMRAFGGRLTEKRSGVLEALLSSCTRLSAYEITEAYNKSFVKNMPAMSVDRILELSKQKIWFII